MYYPNLIEAMVAEVHSRANGGAPNKAIVADIARVPAPVRAAAFAYVEACLSSAKHSGNGHEIADLRAARVELWSDVLDEARRIARAPQASPLA